MNRMVFKYLSATVEIAESFGEPTWKVVNLKSEEPGRMHATVLMTGLCEWADERKIDLFLIAQASGDPRKGTLNNDQLMRFYEKFGFKKDNDHRIRPNKMLRPHDPYYHDPIRWIGSQKKQSL